MNFALRMAIGLVGLLLATTPAAHAATANPSPQHVLAAIEAAQLEAPAIAAFFGSKDAPKIEDQGALDATDGRVSLGAADVAQLVANVPAPLTVQAVRLLAAHEVWHYVELRRRGLKAETVVGEERRLYECRADLEAGRYLASTQLTEGGVGGLRHTQAAVLAHWIWSTESPDHPSPKQRETAVQFGALSYLGDRAWARGDKVLGTEIINSIGFRPGDDEGRWLDETCKRITRFSAQALPRLGIEGPAGDHPEQAGDDAVVRVTYTNRSPAPMKVSVLLTATHITPGDRPGSGIADAYWYRVDSFPLAPCEVRPLVWRIARAGARAGDIYVTYRKVQPGALLSAAYEGAAGAGQVGPTTVAANPAVADDAALAGAIQQIANHMSSGFRIDRGALEPLAGGGERGQLGILVPGALQPPQVQQDATGARRVEAVLHGNERGLTPEDVDAEQAKAAYLHLVTLLKGRWPEIAFNRSDAPRAQQGATFDIDGLATVTAQIGRYRSSGGPPELQRDKYIVSFIVRPSQTAMASGSRGAGGRDPVRDRAGRQPPADDCRGRQPPP